LNVFVLFLSMLIFLYSQVKELTSETLHVFDDLP